MQIDWDSKDDCLDAAKKIARVFSGVILSEFHVQRADQNPVDAVARIIGQVVRLNVQVALQEAAQALRDRLEGDHEEVEADGRIDIAEAIRIVRELDTLGD